MASDGYRRTATLAFALLYLASLGTPATRSVAQARVAASDALPRTAKGMPDFTGFWQAMTPADWDIQDHSASKGVPGGRGIVVGNEIPYQPWAAKQKQENYENREKADPGAKWFAPGVPRIFYTPFPFQILQTPQKIVMLFEYLHKSRQLRYDGSKHPDGHIDWWFGDSRAKWEGDTLTVDVTDFNDKTWFDHTGNFHSDALHIVEHYHFLDANHLSYEATIEDPKVFTKPWQVSFILYRHMEKDFQLLDYEGYAFDYEKYYP